MQPYQHILAAVDGSAPSLHALEQALRLPGWLVSAAAVVPPLPGDPKVAGPQGESRLRAPYEAALARCRELATARGLPLTTLLLKGEPHEAISAAAREQGCDLVVIGKRGHDLPPGAHMGRVTERVIGYCPTDVLVVPARGSLGLDRLLLPVDGSRYSRRATARALSLAAAGAALLVLSVLDAPPGFVTEVPEVAGDFLNSLEELVGDVARQAADRGLSCETRVAVGPAYRTIVELAGQWRAGLIVMGSHGRTGTKRLLMGSVTERVVGQAPCPVLVVKADQRLLGGGPGSGGSLPSPHTPLPTL
jgi:nucleotide-binding universal stress UspA family protein